MYDPKDLINSENPNQCFTMNIYDDLQKHEKKKKHVETSQCHSDLLTILEKYKKILSDENNTKINWI